MPRVPAAPFAVTPPGATAVVLPPPRIPDPPRAWPASPAWPEAPTGDLAQRAAVYRHTLTDAQHGWLAAYGAPAVAVLLIPGARLGDGTFQALTHREEPEFLALVAQHFPPARDGGAGPVAPHVGVAGLHYYVAHAPFTLLCTAVVDLLEDARLEAVTIAAIWARLAPDLRWHTALGSADGERQHTAQLLLHALAEHRSFPLGCCPALAALALDPALRAITQPRDVPSWGARLAFDRLRRGLQRGHPDAVGLAPEALAPLLAVAPAPWREILLTEVLPALRPAERPTSPPPASRPRS